MERLQGNKDGCTQTDQQLSINRWQSTSCFSCLCIGARSLAELYQRAVKPCSWHGTHWPKTTRNIPRRRFQQSLNVRSHCSHHSRPLNLQNLNNGRKQRECVFGPEVAYSESWVQEDCPYSRAGTLRQDTFWTDPPQTLPELQPDMGPGLWTGPRSAPWRLPVRSGGPRLGRCCPSLVPAWWGSGGKAVSCRESQDGTGSTGRR